MYVVTDPADRPATRGGAAAAPDASFDRYARMVRRALRVPTALVTIVEDDRQVFPGMLGLPEPWATQRSTPLSHSFCQYVVADQAPLVVTDARFDSRLRDNLAIRDLDVVAYAGWPITDHTGQVVGSLCAIDSRPHVWLDEELAALADLAAACSAELAERELRVLAAERASTAERMVARAELLLTLGRGLGDTSSLEQVATVTEQTLTSRLGCQRVGVWLVDQHDAVHERPRRLSYCPPADGGWESARIHGTVEPEVRHPIGACFLRQELLLFSDRTDQNQRFPDLDISRQIGEARAMIPLVVHGRPLGVLVLMWAEERHDLETEMAVLTTVSNTVAQAIARARLLEDQRTSLITLQNALLPRLPASDTIDLAARYLPAAAHEYVGGDWFDAIVLPSGAVTIMTGDVVGHDMRAAATMGQFRHTLRALAWAVEDTPAATVRLLDRAIADLQLEGMASAVVVRIEPPAGDSDQRRVAVSSAGHPTPYVALPDGTVRPLVEGPNDMLLGVDPDVPRRTFVLDLPRGSVLLAYTDGLVERRRENLDVGRDRLVAALGRSAGKPVEDLVDTLLAELVPGDQADDVAVVAARLL